MLVLLFYTQQKYVSYYKNIHVDVTTWHICTFTHVNNTICFLLNYSPLHCLCKQIPACLRRWFLCFFGSHIDVWGSKLVSLVRCHRSPQLVCGKFFYRCTLLLGAVGSGLRWCKKQAWSFLFWRVQLPVLRAFFPICHWADIQT